MSQHFVFLSKDTTLVPQSLNDADAGEIIRSLLLQQFSLSPLRLQADNSREALEKYYSLKLKLP